MNTKNLKKNRRNRASIKVFAILVMLFLSISIMFLKTQPVNRAFSKIEPVNAASDVFSEDFTTTTYIDSGDTNVTGWGSGGIRLPKKEPSFIGAYDTVNESMDVYISGDSAFIADYYDGLQIIDISDPSTPTYIGSYNTPDRAVGIYVEDDYAYIADYNSGLLIFNVSNLSNPQLIGTCGGFFPSPDPSLPGDVVVSGDYAYVADRSFYNGTAWVPAFWIADISDPTNPSIVAYQETSDESDGVYVSGNFAYITIRSGGIEVYNITDPRNPNYIASCNVPGQAMEIDVSGDYAFVAAGSAGLQIINITNPVNPKNISSYDTPGNALSVVISGNVAFLADSDSGIQMVNISDITNPTYAGYYDTPGKANSVFLSGRNAYVADGDAGLHVLRVRDRVGPNLAGSYDTPDEAYGIYVSGDYVYVADYTSGLQVIDISNPRNPTLAGSYSTPSDSTAVFISGDYAYIADATSGLQVLNISDPTDPTFVDSYNTPDRARDVWVSGDYAYVADGNSGLQVIDISDPTNLTFAGSYSTLDYAEELFISGDYAYLAVMDAGLEIVNISDPTTPTYVGSYNTPAWAHDVFISGDFAYVAGYSTGLISINITDPTNPTLGDSLFVSGYATGVFVSGDYAYVASNMWSMAVVDISNPKSLFSPSYYNVPNAYGVFVSGDYVYLTAGTTGLVVLEVMRNRYRQYEPMAVSQSLSVFSGSNLVSLVKVNLSSNHSVPSSTTIDYYVSADNGSNWESVTPGVEHNFTNLGNRLKWKAVLMTLDSLKTPLIFNLSITYHTGLLAPSLISPSDGVSSNDNTPTFIWESISGVSNYLIQIDTLPSFDTINLINETVSSASYSPTVPLSDGTWYWRVGAFDSEGDLGFLSPIQSVIIFFIPLTAPTLSSPINNSKTNDNTPTFSWSEVTGAINYTLQLDKSNTFSTPDLITLSGIESTEYILTTPLSDGTWYWRVCAYNSDGDQGPYSNHHILVVDTGNGVIPGYKTPLFIGIMIFMTLGIIYFDLKKEKLRAKR